MDESNFVDTAESTEAGADLQAAIDADWDDTPTAAETDEGEQADQPEEESEEDAADETETGSDESDTEESGETDKEESEKEEQKKSDETFELKYLGEIKTVSRDEMKALAQKGMDYDRIRAERDALKAEKENGNSNNEFELFVKELAESQKTTPNALMEQQRVRRLMIADRTLSAEKAREQVRAETAKRNADREASAKRAESFKTFAQNHPDVKPEDIPKSVWDDVANGRGDINEAYDRWSSAEETNKLAQKNKELEDEIAALRENQKNKQRSTGSRKSRGASKRSAFDDLWYDGT